jgi:hypothetical protein
MSYAQAILDSDLAPARAYVQILDAMNARHFSATEGRPASFDQGLEVLSRGERALILATDFRFQVYGDGFHDYFGNTNCRHAHATARALDLLDLPKAAEFLRRALSTRQVPDPLPEGYGYDHAEIEPPALAELAREYYQAKPDADFEVAVVRYVRQHPEEFV